MPRLAPDDDDTSPSPPQEEAIVDLCDTEDDDDDDDEQGEVTSDSPDAPMRRMPDPLVNKNVLSSDWRKIITKKSDRRKNPKLPECYYFNSRTGETSWFPPRPLLPGEENNVGAGCVGKVANSKKSGMERYYRSVRQPKVTPEEELTMESEPEDEEDDTEDDVEIVDVEDDDTEELSEVEKIQRQVFTGHKPEFLKMRGQGGLIERTKELGIYEDKILRRQLEEKLQKHWITQLGEKGSKEPVDDYFLSPVFKQDEVMPSSGAAERVFSLLSNHFNQHQTRTLADKIFLSLYLSYNKRKL